jgi:hypothetical protein
MVGDRSADLPIENPSIAPSTLQHRLPAMSNAIPGAA